MYVLSLETSFDKLQVAVFNLLQSNLQSHEVLFDRVKDSLATVYVSTEKGKQAEEVLEDIDVCLHSLNLSLDDISYLLVNRGPGSFVGTRLGISVAQGIATAKTHIKVMLVSGLEMLAWQVESIASLGGIVSPQIDKLESINSTDSTVKDQETSAVNLTANPTANPTANLTEINKKPYQYLLVAMDANMREVYAGLYRDGKLVGEENLLGIAELEFIAQVVNHEISAEQYPELIKSLPNAELYQSLGLSYEILSSGKVGFVGNGFSKYKINLESLRVDHSNQSVQNLIQNYWEKLSASIADKIRSQIILKKMQEKFKQEFKENSTDQSSKQTSTNSPAYSIQTFLETYPMEYFTQEASAEIAQATKLALENLPSSNDESYFKEITTHPLLYLQAELIGRAIAEQRFTPRLEIEPTYIRNKVTY